jgi:hypothetical protein
MQAARGLAVLELLERTLIPGSAGTYLPLLVTGGPHFFSSRRFLFEAHHLIARKGGQGCPRSQEEQSI